MAGIRDKVIGRKDVVKILVYPLHLARGPLTGKTIGKELGVGFVCSVALGYVSSKYIFAAEYERTDGGSIDDLGEFARWYSAKLIGSAIGAYLGVWQIGRRYFDAGTPEATIAGSFIGGAASGLIVFTIPNEGIGYFVPPVFCTIGAVMGFNGSRVAKTDRTPQASLVVMEKGEVYLGAPLVYPRRNPFTGRIDRALNLLQINF